MNILITNLILVGNSGTEMYVVELALELKKRGHFVEVYTLIIGKAADLLISHDINVVSSLKSLKSKPNIIHAHHNIVTALAAMHFKKIPIVFFVHDRKSSHDYPFTHSNIIKYLAVDYNCKERYYLETSFSNQNDVEVIFNWYNPARFSLKKIINDTPAKALIFSNYMKKDIFFDSINSACYQLNIKLEIVGGNSGNSIMFPERILSDYDIVFAKAKAGIESMSTGACLIVCDYGGLAGMVIPENVDTFRNYNFGMKLMTRRIEPGIVLEELKKYDAQKIAFVSNFIRENADFNIIINQLEKLYIKSIDEFHLKGKGKYHYSFSNHMKIIYLTRHTYLYPFIKRLSIYRFIRPILKIIFRMTMFFKRSITD